MRSLDYENFKNYKYEKELINDLCFDTRYRSNY